METPQRGGGGTAIVLPKYCPPKHLDLEGAEAALKRAEDMVRDVEEQIWNCETRILEQRDPKANFLTGYEGLLLGTLPVTMTGRINPEERIFSNSSVTPPNQ
jgi:hypothetical protein